MCDGDSERSEVCQEQPCPSMITHFWLIKFKVFRLHNGDLRESVELIIYCNALAIHRLSYPSLENESKLQTLEILCFEVHRKAKAEFLWKIVHYY